MCHHHLPYYQGPAYVCVIIIFRITKDQRTYVSSSSSVLPRTSVRMCHHHLPYYQGPAYVLCVVFIFRTTKVRRRYVTSLFSVLFGTNMCSYRLYLPTVKVQMMYCPYFPHRKEPEDVYVISILCNIFCDIKYSVCFILVFPYYLGQAYALSCLPYC